MSVILYQMQILQFSLKISLEVNLFDLLLRKEINNHQFDYHYQQLLPSYNLIKDQSKYRFKDLKRHFYITYKGFTIELFPA